MRAKSFVFTDGGQSLMMPFLNVLCMLVKSEIIVHYESMICETITLRRSFLHTINCKRLTISPPNMTFTILKRTCFLSVTTHLCQDKPIDMTAVTKVFAIGFFFSCAFA